MKKLINKKALCLLLSVVALFSSFSSVISAGAALPPQNDAAVPYYVNLIGVDARISISGATATCTASVKSVSSCSLYIKMELQKKKSDGNYETVEQWISGKTGTSASAAEKKVINIFSEYRLRATLMAGSDSQILYRYP